MSLGESMDPILSWPLTNRCLFSSPVVLSDSRTAFNGSEFSIDWLLVIHGSVSPAKHEEEEDEDYNNYDISDLRSDDSTDDELEPRKKLPAWADGQYCL